MRFVLHDGIGLATWSGMYGGSYQILKLYSIHILLYLQQKWQFSTWTIIWLLVRLLLLKCRDAVSTRTMFLWRARVVAILSKAPPISTSHSITNLCTSQVSLELLRSALIFCVMSEKHVETYQVYIMCSQSVCPTFIPHSPIQSFSFFSPSSPHPLPSPHICTLKSLGGSPGLPRWHNRWSLYTQS